MTIVCVISLFFVGAGEARARDWGTCGDCYQFFAFSVPGLYTGCVRAEIQCGGSGACLCRLHAKLAEKYTREYMFQKELSFWLRFGYGVFVPGVQLIDPDNRAKLTDPDIPFHEKTDLIFDKSLVIFNVAGLGWEAASELNNMIGLMNAMSHAADAKEKPADRVVNTMIGVTPYMGGMWEVFGNELDLSMQSKDLVPDPDKKEE